MLKKLTSIFTLVFSVAPTVLSDVEGFTAKLKTDTTLSAKVDDVLNLAIEVLEQIVKML